MSNDIITVKSTIPLLKPVASDELIRLGRDNDGGYVVSKAALENSDVLFSGGYGNDFSFEHAYVNNFNGKAIIFDFSITILSLLRDVLKAILFKILGRHHYPIRYHLKNIITYFYLALTPSVNLKHVRLGRSHRSISKKTMGLEEAFKVAESTIESKFFCKLDIESSEYELIEELVVLQSRITGMVIEFHDTSLRREDFIASLNKLNIDFVIAHTHVNNYGGLANDSQPVIYEISFLNRRIWSGELRQNQLECWVPLDQPNNPEAPEIVLKF